MSPDYEAYYVQPHLFTNEASLRLDEQGLLTTMIEAGILSSDNSDAQMHYAKVRVQYVSILVRAEKGEDYDLVSPHPQWQSDVERWRLRNHGDADPLNESIGFMTACEKIIVEGKPRLFLRVSPSIVDIDEDSCLIPLCSIEAISILPPQVSEALLLTENYTSLNDRAIDFALKLNYETSVLDYLRHTPDFQTVWTPEASLIPVWGPVQLLPTIEAEN